VCYIVAIHFTTLQAESVAPFLESTEFVDSYEAGEAYCVKIVAELANKGVAAEVEDDAPKKLQSAVNMGQQMRAEEAAALEQNEYMWGVNKVREEFNSQDFDMQQVAVSARQERKEVRKERIREHYEELDEAEDAAWENEVILPDFEADTGERDIHCGPFTLFFRNLQLLTDAHLKLVYGRRYGIGL
jgi:hypothetical protein